MMRLICTTTSIAPYESFHAFKNCKAPPDRYDQDYPWLNDGAGSMLNEGQSAWNHFIKLLFFI